MYEPTNFLKFFTVNGEKILRQWFKIENGYEWRDVPCEPLERPLGDKQFLNDIIETVRKEERERVLDDILNFMVGYDYPSNFIEEKIKQIRENK